MQLLDYEWLWLRVDARSWFIHLWRLCWSWQIWPQASFSFILNCAATNKPSWWINHPRGKKEANLLSLIYKCRIPLTLQHIGLSNWTWCYGSIVLYIFQIYFGLININIVWFDICVEIIWKVSTTWLNLIQTNTSHFENFVQLQCTATHVSNFKPKTF